MTRGDHGLPKASPRPAMPYPFTPCGQAIPETAMLYPFGQPTLYAYERDKMVIRELGGEIKGDQRRDMVVVRTRGGTK
jgi:hypothetical protein